jgi:dipeptidyl aminopeptidase/acylaminoacyl peptidase
MPATGGQRKLLTQEIGRSRGFLSPDKKNLAYIHSHAKQLPDLFIRSMRKQDRKYRITVSGSDNFYRYPLRTPEIVSFAHKDGGKVWGGIYRPEEVLSNRPAVIHIHGGGYRQFSHKGYSVYGFDNHLGFINYMVQEGYTVLDLDYRGSAGFGRDYRTDIYRSMGIKDVESVVAGVKYLVEEEGVDSERIGMYGISYGGFLTLATLFNQPGMIKAGIANAAVTDWAHYNQVWTERILNDPVEDPEAYRVSSPIYHAAGLEDELLITHGLNDGNVHFQDAARLVQRLMELEKDFEWMVYPIEPHTIETEANRYDYVKRAKAFFEMHLNGN